MLNGDDQHAICQQITGLLSADIEFRTMNGALELSQSAGNPQNGLVHWLTRPLRGLWRSPIPKFHGLAPEAIAQTP
jgi:hypothetical protein